MGDDCSLAPTIQLLIHILQSRSATLALAGQLHANNGVLASLSATIQNPQLDQTISEVPADAAGTCRQLSGLNKSRALLLRVFPFQVVLTMIVLAVPFLLARTGINDPDIWWHLRNAEYLVQHHHVPDRDLYSFTVPGYPWINHEWLSEVPYYFAWRAFGIVGVKSLSLLLIWVILVELLYLSSRESGNFKAAVAACCFAGFLSSVSFGPRTILFGYVYLVSLLIVLQRLRQKGTAPLWVLPLLFCLWANTHGSWLIGLIIFSIVIGAGLVKGSWGLIDAKPWSTSQIRKLAISWGLSVAALFVNPFGARLVTYPLDLAFRQKLNIAHVAEWVSVDFHTLRGKMVLGLIVVLLLTALVRRSRWTLTESLVLLFALYSGLTYIRFLVLLAIIAAPVIAKALDFFPPYRLELETPIVNAVVVIAMLCAMVHYWPKAAELQRSVDDDYPTQVLPYLKVHPPAGPMLNFYLWGGYLGWNNNDVKVFIDSRVDIFEYTGVLQDYLNLLSLQNPEAILDKYHIQSVLFPREEPLTHVLQMDPRWRTTYSDELSVLLERNMDGYKRVAAHGGSAP